MLVVLLFLAFGGRAISIAQHGRVLANPGKGEIIPLDVTLYNDSMIVYPGIPEPPQACFKQSVNLHIFSRQLVAIKIVEKDVCYIKTSTETFDEVATQLRKVKMGDRKPITQFTEEWIVPKEHIESEDVKDRFGPHIARFCTGYNVYVLEDGHVIDPEDLNNVRRAIVEEQASEDCNGCYKCKVKTRG